jgi:CheY-like chemotaxis protein
MSMPPWIQASPLRVLVADDNRDTVGTLMLLLQDEGHEARGAYNGTDVMRIARLHRFDAIILDIEMPEMSGYAIAQELRTLYYGQALRPAGAAEAAQIAHFGAGLRRLRS